MEIHLNSRKIDIPENIRLLELLKAHGYNHTIAIWINDKHLLMKEYDDYPLKENDMIKVVRILGGG